MIRNPAGRCALIAAVYVFAISTAHGAVVAGGQAQDALPASLETEVRRLPPIAFVVQDHFGNPDGVVRYHSRQVVRSWGCRIQVLEPSRPDQAPRTIYENAAGAIFDMNLSFDARTLFFSMREGEKDHWHLCEIGVDGSGFRRITTDGYHDFAPAEMPNGDLVFVSTRVKSFNMCAWELATSLFAIRRDGTGLRQITVNTLNEMSPQIMPDGQILYTRWEYVDRDVKWRQSLWTVNPDGTSVRLYFGNTKRDPAVFWQARPLPTSAALVATFAPHHGWPMGAIGLVTNAYGVESTRGVGFDWITQEYPSIGDNAALTEWAYRDPFPISDERFLVSYGGGRSGTARRFTIQLLDRQDRKAQVWDDGRWSCTYPLPLARRERPPVRAEMERPAGVTTGVFLLQDVYAGMGGGVPRGEITALRIMEQVPKYPYNETGSGRFRVYEMDPVMGQRCYYVKRCLGVVPVEEDGSAHFTVPALKELYFQALDADGRAVQSMGSAVNLVPGEKQSCVGCHDDRKSAPSTRATIASRKPPVDPLPYAWGNGGNIDFTAIVQPVLDKHCVNCHGGAMPQGGMNLSGDKTRFFNMAYDELFRRDLMHTIRLTANDSQVIPPKKAFSYASRLRGYIEATAKGHEQVLLSKEERERFYVWMDSNANYYGTYARTRPGTRGSRDLWAGPWFRDRLLPVYKAQCASCHPGEPGSGGYPADAHLINLTHPDQSRLLTAHLAAAAGGQGLAKPRDGKVPPVFASRDVPALRTILQAIEEGRSEMLALPRMDMPGAVPRPGPDDWGRFRGTVPE